MKAFWVLLFALTVSGENFEGENRDGKETQFPPPSPNLRQNLNQYQLAFILPSGQANVPINSNGLWINGGNVQLPNVYRPPPVPPVEVTKPVEGNVVTGLQDEVSVTHWCIHQRGQFPSRYCNKFVNCWDGNAIEQFCPPTLRFNPKGYCDYAYNVDCQGKPIQEIATTAPVGLPDDGSYKPPAPIPPVSVGSGWPSDGSYKPPSTQAPPPSHGGWPSDGSYRPPVTIGPIHPPTEIPIHPPTHGPIVQPIHPPIDPPTQAPIHPPTQAPIHPPIHYPTPVTLPPPIVTPPPTPPNELRKYCLKPRGQFPSKTCSKFVNCWDDTILEQDCPEGLHFNAAKGYCDYILNANCNNSGVHKNVSPCPVIQGTFRMKHNCTHYYTCFNNEIVAQYECPHNYLFNDVIGVCDLASRVDCSKDPLTVNAPFTKSNLLPPALIDPSYACKPGTIFRLNSDCSNVSLCRDGYTEFIQCPVGLSYDVISDKCLETSLAKC